MKSRRLIILETLLAEVPELRGLDPDIVANEIARAIERWEDTKENVCVCSYFNDVRIRNLLCMVHGGYSIERQ